MFYIEQSKVLNRTIKRGLNMYFWDQHKTITLYYEMLTASTCDKYNLKKMEYDILMFLYHNPEYNTAADIVRIRKSTKSHVSTALKVLEDRGYITKKINENNKKRVELFLEDSANEIVKEGLNVQNQFAHDMLQGLTDEEIKVCRNVFEKICRNAEECIQKKGL